MKVTYFINQYPKVSHSFIRREILALEKIGADVQRVALRGWDSPIVNEADFQEANKTYYVLKSSILSLILTASLRAISSPIKFLKVLKLSWFLSRYSDRSVFLHFFSVVEACKIIPWLRNHNSEHVHAHFGTNSAEIALYSSILTGVPFSFTIHGPEEFDKPKALHLKKKVEHAKFVACISSYGRSQLFRHVSTAEWHKVKVVHCGLEKEFYDCSLPPITSHPRLVCVGRLSEQKGQILLIEACKILVEKGIDFELILAGDGEMRSELESLINKYSLENYISITGWIGTERVKKAILESKALILPSFAEGLPVVIMESMALSRPVLTTYVAGIPELVRDAENGWLFPAGDVSAIVNSMEKCLTCTHSELSRMGENARRRVLERHDIDNESRKIFEYMAQR